MQHACGRCRVGAGSVLVHLFDAGGKHDTRPAGHVERCRWWLYHAAGDDSAVLEQWGSDYRLLRGQKVVGDTIDLIPGS